MDAHHHPMALKLSTLILSLRHKLSKGYSGVAAFIQRLELNYPLAARTTSAVCQLWAERGWDRAEQPPGLTSHLTGAQLETVGSPPSNKRRTRRNRHSASRARKIHACTSSGEAATAPGRTAPRTGGVWTLPPLIRALQREALCQGSLVAHLLGKLFS